jgi:hypothetical protein
MSLLYVLFSARSLHLESAEFLVGVRHGEYPNAFTRCRKFHCPS